MGALAPPRQHAPALALLAHLRPAPPSLQRSLSQSRSLSLSLSLSLPFSLSLSLSLSAPVSLSSLTLSLCPSLPLPLSPSLPLFLPPSLPRSVPPPIISLYISICVSFLSLSLSCRVAGTRRQPHTPLSHRRFVSRVDINWEGRVRARHVKNRNLQLAGAQQPSHSLPQATGGGARFASRLPISQSVQKKRGARGAREAWGLPISGTVQGKRNVAPGFQARRSIQGTSSPGTQRAKRWALLQTSPAGPVMQYLCAAPPRSLERL